MSKKILIGAIVIVLIVVGIWVALVKERPPIREVLPEEKPLPEIVEEEIIIGYGWSRESDEEKAAEEAVNKIREQLKGKTPDWALLYSTVGYDAERLLREVNQVLGLQVKIQGITSFEGVMSNDGWHEDGIALLGIWSPKIEFGFGHVEIGESGRKAGQEAIKKALEDIGKMAAEKPKLILMHSAPGVEEEILKGIADVVGGDVPVIGGASGDNDLSGKWKQFANNRVYSNGVTLTAFYTDLKIGYQFSSGLGYIATDKAGVVTKAEGRTIYTIDNRPAAEVYNEWLDGEITDQLEQPMPGGLLFKGIMDPLVQILRGEKGVTYYMTIHPVQVNLPEKSLTSLAVTEKGQEMSIMHGTLESHLVRGPLITRMARAQGRITAEEVAGGIFICCACTHMVLDKLPGFYVENVPKLTAGLNDAFEGKPFIGAFTFGEQGFLPGIGNRHQNLITNMIVFSKK